jgi:hypothetical protein
MEATIRTEQRLLEALGELENRMTKDSFCEDLYRGLASRRWRPEAGGDAISLSWQRAEEVVNLLRGRVGEAPLELAQRGGEGELSEDVGRALEERGWRSEPLDTSQQQSRHVDEPHGPPPPEQGEQQAPVEPSAEWRQAATQAERRSS